MAGVMTYNGVGIHYAKSRVSSKPVLDEAGRAVAYVEHVIDVDGYITTEDNADGAGLETLRKRLTAVAAHLIYNDKGFGTLSVNADGGTVRDAKWGPIPDVFDFVPFGEMGAAKLKFRVTTRIPECDLARYARRLMSYNYEVDISHDGDNYTVVRVSGYLEIPMTRRTPSDRRMPDSVDQYRDELESTCPLGYQRTEKNFHISKDKRRLDFRYTDTEIPRPLPEQCTKVDFKHLVSSSLGAGAFRRWQIRFDGTINIARGHVRGVALRTFIRLMMQRMTLLQQSMNRPNGATLLLPQTYSAEEDVFGRSSRFTTTWECVLAGDVAEFMLKSGLWRPIGTDWLRWRASMDAVRANSPPAWSRANVLAADDAIIDLCEEGRNIEGLHTGAPPPDTDAAPSMTGASNVTVANLAPRTSWLDYQAELTYREAAGVVRHKQLPPDVDGNGNAVGERRGAAPGEVSATDMAVILAAIGGPGTTGGQGKLPEDVFQRVSSPTRYLVLTGSGMRVNYRVPVPTLTSVGGAPVVELFRNVGEKDVSVLGDLALRGRWWTIVYGLGKAPSNLPQLANPALGIDGGEGTKPPPPSLGGFITR